MHEIAIWTTLLLCAGPLTAQGLEWTLTTEIGSSGTSTAMEVADLNGDGALDIVSGSSTTVGGVGELWWLANPGTPGGTWTKTVVDPSQTFRYLDLRVADFDGDGHLDLLSLSDFGLRVWRNDLGDGSAWSAIDIGFTVILQRDDIATGDVDGDGDQDILIAEKIVPNISWYENRNGDGTLWARHVVSSSFQRLDSMLPLDADGDGDLDIGGAADGVVGWLENVAGDGTTWVERGITVPNERVYLGVASDLDGAGGVDLVAIDEDEAVVAYLNTNADGSSWSALELVSGASRAETLYGGDLDDDGFPDLAILQTFPVGITSLESLGLGTHDFLRDEITFDVSFSFPPLDLALADMDGDGVTDMVTASSATRPFELYTSRSANRFYVPDFRDFIDATLNQVPTAMALGDLDGDGDPDAVGAYPTVDRLDWWENDGSADGWTERSVSPEGDTTHLATGDLDSDGDTDVLSASDIGLQWFENTGVFTSTWGSNAVGAVLQTSSIEAADVDADGDLDVLVAAEGEGAIGWFENSNGDGLAWSFVGIEALAPGASWAKSLDVDADGDLDVLAADAQLGSLAWYSNEGGQGSAWTLHLLATDVPGAARLVAGDYDRDGDLDLAGSGSADARILLFENLDGAGGRFGRTERALASGAPTDLIFSDLDVDGDADLLVATTDVPIWLEAGSGEEPAEWVARDLPFDAAFDLLSADLDADLLPDVVVMEDLGAIWWSTNGTGLLRYGVGVNPRDSLVLLQGRPELGNQLLLGIDNPLGTQAAGATTLLALSLASAPGFPAGVLLPDFGLSGPGTSGELLLDLSSTSLLPPILAGPAWDGSSPAEVLLTVPDDTSLLGTVIYAQGAILDPSAAFGVPRGLTNGLRIELVPSLL